MDISALSESVKKQIRLSGKEEADQLQRRKLQLRGILNHFNKQVAALPEESREAFLSMFYEALIKATFKYHAVAVGMISDDKLLQAKTRKDGDRIIADMSKRFDDILALYEIPGTL